ncbi:MAG: ABC transporter permease [Proteobacteria bacterium]|nr:ABC transporter permease [Pseudomonadota bacterium]MBU1739761.1 ABC transporter permease [Pseudomonadota bacterium]
MNGLSFHTIWMRNFRVWRKFVLSSLIGNLGQPLLFLLAMGYGLGRNIELIDGLSYLQFIAPGLVASSVMYSAAFETTYGAYTRLSVQKTYEAILTTPLGVTDLVLGEIFWAASKGVFAGVIMLATLPLFGVWPSGWTIALLPVLFLSGVFFAAFGLIMTALATNYDFFNYFISLVITPLFLFSGIFFSLKTMAPKARLIFEFLPLTPIVNLARMFCYGQIQGPWLLEIAGSLLLTFFTVWLAVVMLHRRLIQ